LQETRLFICGFSCHATFLTNTTQLPIGQWLNANGVHLVNDKMMKNLQNTRHSDLIIYKSYATYVLSGTRGKWRLSNHLSITIGVDLVLICRKMWLHIV
jgi:hypothetical protein